MKKILVTTALEETWGKDEDIVFLGEWCKLYGESGWTKRQHQTVPYHWDDRDKLVKDYQIVNEHYEKALDYCAKNLNIFHRTEYSLRYWRIVIGPWLILFTHILYDRYEMIHKALREFEIDRVVVKKESSLETIVPLNILDFSSKYSDDPWNLFIYSRILKDVKQIEKVEFHRDDFVAPRRTPSTKKGTHARTKKILQTIGRLLNHTQLNNKCFIMDTPLPHINECLLALRLGQIPQWCSDSSDLIQDLPIEQKMRDWPISKKCNEVNFFNLLIQLIPTQIPKVYLEGYHHLSRIADHFKWPNNPETIFVANIYEDPVLQTYIGKTTEKGARLFIGQHGGHYGTGKFSIFEDHEFSCADSFFTWGWKYPGKNNLLPIGMIKKAGKSFKHRSQDKKGLLLASCNLPRYSYYLYSTMISSQCISHFQDSIDFAKSLDEDIFNALIVRVHPTDFRWRQKQRWENSLPNITFDKEVDMRKSLADSRIFVATYNATTFLESMTMNIPTIMFWNEEHWELNEYANPHFQSLKDVGILHSSPDSAARQVNQIYHCVDEWWQSPEVERTVNEFKEVFAKPHKNLTGFIASQLKQKNSLRNHP